MYNDLKLEILQIGELLLKTILRTCFVIKNVDLQLVKMNIKEFFLKETKNITFLNI